MGNIVLLALTTAVSKLSENVIKDAYESIKKLILKKVKGREKENIENAIRNVEEKPSSDGRKKVLQEELEILNLHNDQKIKEAAIRLYQLCNPSQDQKVSITQTSGDYSVTTGINSGNIDVKIEE